VSFNLKILFALMKESTKIMIRKHGWRVDRAIHNYIYFVFYYPYVKGFHIFAKLVNKYLTWFKPLVPITRAIMNRYHAKVLSFGDTKKIFSINQDITAISNQNKKIVPFDYAYRIIFEQADYIAVMDCPCKKSMNAPKDRILSCLAVGKALASFWLDHCQKYNPRKISQGEAIDLIKRFRKMGYITQAFFKVATGGSTGVICNCHPDTCVSLYGTKVSKELNENLSQSVESGYSVRRDESKCKNCGTCAKTCHFGAIVIKDEVRLYNKNTCWGCELCVENCPNGALTLYMDSDKSVPLDIDLIKEHFADYR
jgi:ferredoxin